MIINQNNQKKTSEVITGTFTTYGGNGIVIPETVGFKNVIIVSDPSTANPTINYQPVYVQCLYYTPEVSKVAGINVTGSIQFQYYSLCGNTVVFDPETGTISFTPPVQGNQLYGTYRYFAWR